MIRKLFAALVLVAIILGAGAYMLPSDVHVERSIVVDRRPPVVFELVNSLRRLREWSPWMTYDPNAKLAYSGAEAGIGARMEWAGNSKVGTGSQLITESLADRRVASELHFGGMGPAKAAFELEPEGEGTRVLWTLDLDVGLNPIGRYAGLFMDKMVGADFELGLARLKALAERQPAGPAPADPAQPVSAATTPANAPVN